MFEVDQDLQGLAHDRMRSPALDVRDKSNAARIVFVRRVVKTLSGGLSRLLHCTVIDDVQL